MLWSWLFPKSVDAPKPAKRKAVDVVAARASAPPQEHLPPISVRPYDTSSITPLPLPTPPATDANAGAAAAAGAAFLIGAEMGLLGQSSGDPGAGTGGSGTGGDSGGSGSGGS